MALDISPCVTDDDLEEWRRVRIAVIPYERTQSIAELRADDDARAAARSWRARTAWSSGHGLANRSEIGRAGTVIPRVLPEHRRRGVGTALLERLADARRRASAYPTVRAGADDEGSLAFARRFGFEEVNREVEQTYRLTAARSRSTPAPDGIEVVTAQDRPGLWEARLRGLRPRGARRLRRRHPARRQPRSGGRATWLGDPMFLALHDGEVVGCAGLGLDPDQPTRAENGLTAVRRDWRGRGLAVHLKLVTLAWAAEHGIEEVYTWTQDGNAAMRALNERLGYDTTMVGIQLARPLAGLLGHA